jgi:hypothetical protein
MIPKAERTKSEQLDAAEHAQAAGQTKSEEQRLAFLQSSCPRKATAAMVAGPADLRGR